MVLAICNANFCRDYHRDYCEQQSEDAITHTSILRSFDKGTGVVPSAPAYRLKTIMTTLFTTAATRQSLASHQSLKTEANAHT
jgi:hypothetical protein